MSPLHKEIAGKVGLGQNILPRTALAAGDGDESRKQMESADGFAQVLPEDKFRIVKILQGGDHIVGMTGDGVNDAPALRRQMPALRSPVRPMRQSLPRISSSQNPGSPLSLMRSRGAGKYSGGWKIMQSTGSPRRSGS